MPILQETYIIVRLFYRILMYRIPISYDGEAVRSEGRPAERIVYEIKTLHCGSSDGDPDGHMLTRSEHLRRRK